MNSYNIYYQNKTQLKNSISKLKINKNSEILIQVFTSIFDLEKINKIKLLIKTNIPNAKIIGTTTDGEILNSKVSTSKTVISITIFEKSNVDVKSVSYNKSCLRCFEFGEKIGKLFTNKPKLLITFTDGLNINGEDFISGLKNILPNTIIAGGMAGSDIEFKKSIVFSNDSNLKNGAVIAAIYSDNLRISTYHKFDWNSIGKDMTITKAKKNRVFKINDKTAYDTYKHYLGSDIAKKLPNIGVEFPLIIKNRDNINIARAVLGVKNDGSLIFGGNLKEGDIVKFGYGNAQDMIDNSQNIYNEIIKSNPSSIFIYSCMARRRFLPNSIELEIEPISKITNCSGFFTNGEFFTDINNKKSMFMNETMTILALSESNIINSKNSTKVAKVSNNKKSCIAYNIYSKKALTNLINVTSNELENSNKSLNSLNNNLQDIINNKILEIREKDNILIQQSKMAAMGEMISNIAHQWRQPLNNIGALNMRLESILESKECITAKDFYPLSESINEQLEYMSKTIDDFRGFFSNSSIKESFNLCSAVDEVYKIFHKSYEIKNIQLLYRCNNIEVFGIKNEFKQVLVNILNNAKDAIIEKNNKSKNYIVIKFKENSSNIVINIQDSGGGIPSDTIKSIFEPYFTTKFKSKGTGIGLYMSYNIIKNHFNGELKAKNSSFKIDNKEFFGANFIISIPKI